MKMCSRVYGRGREGVKKVFSIVTAIWHELGLRSAVLLMALSVSSKVTGGIVHPQLVLYADDKP
jgi:hypothetical protein